MVFSYTVAEGDLDDDGISIGANKLTLNSGSIKDAADNAANLSHDALSVQTGHKVDGVRPTISSVSLVSSTGGSDGVYTAGETLTASVDFDEDVIVSGGPNWNSTSRVPSNWPISVTPIPNVKDHSAASAQDLGLYEASS